ncbi:MAG: hypothetical protein AAGC74_01825 [Verrucomicrobiota bacterium]
MVIVLIASGKREIWIWGGSCIAATLACYLLLVSLVWVTEVGLKRNLEKFDLDGDGAFSGEEITPEMEKAMEAVTQDTGRTFAPITGLVICPVYSGFWHFVGGVSFLVFLRGEKRREEVGDWGKEWREIFRCAP